MKDLKHFFDKFNLAAVKEIKKRDFIAELIKKEINQEIPIENFSIKDGVLTIKTSQIVKSQIFIKKKRLISLLSEKINIVDIR